MSKNGWSGSELEIKVVLRRPALRTVISKNLVSGLAGFEEVGPGTKLPGQVLVHGPDI